MEKLMPEGALHPETVREPSPDEVDYAALDKPTGIRYPFQPNSWVPVYDSNVGPLRRLVRKLGNYFRDFPV